MGFSIGLVGASVATLLGMLGGLWWGLELFSHFAVQLVVAQLVCLAGVVFFRHRWIAIACIPFVLINIFSVSGYYRSPGAAAVGATEHSVRVMSLNLLIANRRVDLVEAAIATENPDVILLQEVTPAWQAALRRALKDYPYEIRKIRDDPFSIMLKSRFPLRNARILRPAPDSTPSVLAEICPVAAARCLTLVGAHPVPPIPGAGADRRNRQLAALGRLIAHLERGPLVVVGDLNMTPWSPYFSAFLAQTGLRDSALGLGIKPTWFSDFMLFGLPLDHILVSPGVRVVRRSVGRDMGSDHYPLTADLAY